MKLARDRGSLKFVDELLDIRKETKLLKELKDIRDELNMIRTIFQTQHAVLKEFKRCVLEQLDELDQEDDDRTVLGLGLGRSEGGTMTGSRNYGFREQEQLITGHISDVERMDEQAKAIFESVGHVSTVERGPLETNR